MNDLISRRDAIDCFWDENRMMRDGLDIIKDIRSLPSAERKGEWIDVNIIDPEYEMKIYDHYKCSICNGRFGNITKYCPNCGAKLLN